MTQIHIKKNKSTIRANSSTVKVMKSLGFPQNAKIGKEVTHTLTPQIEGMIKKVKHLLNISQ